MTDRLASDEPDSLTICRHPRVRFSRVPPYRLSATGLHLHPTRRSAQTVRFQYACSWKTVLPGSGRPLVARRRRRRPRSVETRPVPRSRSPEPSRQASASNTASSDQKRSIGGRAGCGRRAHRLRRQCRLDLASEFVELFFNRSDSSEKQLPRALCLPSEGRIDIGNSQFVVCRPNNVALVLCATLDHESDRTW